MTPEEMAKAGIRTQEDAKSKGKASILIVGRPKVGKSTCLATTAPAPFFLNCDGKAALVGAAAEGGKYMAKDVTNLQTWKEGIDLAEKLVKAGDAQSVVVDSVSLLYDTLVESLEAGRDGYELWGEVLKVGIRGIKRLAKLDAHLFLVAHLNKDGPEGIVPMIPGKSREKIGGLVNDWVLFDYQHGRKPHERLFLVGPQEGWNASGRNARRSCEVEATVPALFAELGIPL